MTVTIQNLTPTERRTQLRSLAEHWSDTGEAVRERRLADLAHPSLPAWEVASAWNEYLDAHKTAADLWDRAMPWEDWNPYLTCADRQDAAAEEAAMWATGVLSTLVNGGDRHDRG